jgi:putative spermidine/putrescine transport system permease protein
VAKAGPGEQSQASRAGPALPARRAALAAALRPWALLGPNLLWLGLFMAAPLSLLLVISFKGYEAGRGIVDLWQVANYVRFLSDPFYRQVLLDTLLLGFEVTAVALVVGFPVALSLSRARGWQRGALYFAVLMPLLTSVVARTFGWMILLGNNGFINRTLIAAGLISAPVRLMYSQTGVVIALAEVLLPFMILALDAALLNISPSLYEAARNLGAGPARIFLRITVPLTMPGVISGSLLVFTLTISAFVTPSLIGGGRVKVMPTLIYQQAMTILDWPFGAAIAFILLFTILILTTVGLRLAERRAVPAWSH